MNWVIKVVAFLIALSGLGVTSYFVWMIIAENTAAGAIFVPFGVGLTCVGIVALYGVIRESGKILLHAMCCVIYCCIGLMVAFILFFSWLTADSDPESDGGADLGRHNAQFVNGNDEPQAYLFVLIFLPLGLALVALGLAEGLARTLGVHTHIHTRLFGDKMDEKDASAHNTDEEKATSSSQSSSAASELSSSGESEDSTDGSSEQSSSASGSASGPGRPASGSGGERESNETESPASTSSSSSSGASSSEESRRPVSSGDDSPSDSGSSV
jgi:hypothetical protein